MPCYNSCYISSRNPPRFREHRLVHEPRVPLRGDDRRVPEELLKGGETTTPFDPPASKRVPQLVRVKSRDPAVYPRPGVELAR